MGRENKTYSEKLKDPRWQKKRLQILERDEWLCRTCGRGDKTLHVHHSEYISGRDPWEYEDKYLIVLCEDCHAEITNFLPEVTKSLLLPFKLSLHDSFIWNCAIETFSQWDDLHGLVYTLWELKNRQEDVAEALSDLFRKLCKNAGKEGIYNNQP
jgi:hypothetical protein